MHVVDINWEGEKAFLAYFHDITKNRMVELALREGEKREAQAYDQGRLEILDTILHNIGNAINSVAIGIGTIEEKLANNRLTHHLVSLASAVKDHQENFCDYVKNDPQGQKVAPFIISLADRFEKFDEDLSRILNRVHERTEHISDIIRTQKIISRRSIYRKDINLREAIGNAIAVLQDSINKLKIEVIIDCNNAPKEINTQESEFHQMLVNLIKNSVEAIGEIIASESMEDKPFIKIICYTRANSIVIQLVDNGIGIEGDKLELIFRSGYTTKKHGSGLGLHSIANFVKGCNGNIAALSEGHGKGATMEIVLPLSR
jgi:signal transduction histidine kinase